MIIAVLQRIHLLNNSKLILITEWDACNLIFPGALIKDILSEFFFQPFCLHGSFKYILNALINMLPNIDHSNQQRSLSLLMFINVQCILITV